MELERVKKFLQNYLDSAIIPKFIEEDNNDGIQTLKIYDILKGTYQPPILHIFLDTIPVVNHPSKDTRNKLKKIETDIKDFITIFSIKNPVKIHINKRPLLKKDKTFEKNI